MMLMYRPSDDCFVILDGHDDRDNAIGATNASDLLARKTLDADAAKVGLLRFLDFKDWQTKVCGRVLWSGSIESAMATAPRL